MHLEGETLGEKHRNYNKILQDLSRNQTAPESNPEDDVATLLRIDLACEKKDVDTVLEYLKHPDLLYVSRAIQKSTWLITENEYSHIINPESLNNTLKPCMTRKAFNKLINNVRKHLKDEKRVEEFYRSEIDLDKAAEWLPFCSVQFINDNLKKYNMNIMDTRLSKRICEKSISILENINKDYINDDLMQNTMFYLSTHTEKYLNVIEQKYKDIDCYHRRIFNSKHTKFIMKMVPERIINNFAIYVDLVHLPTFYKYLPKENITDFLLKQLQTNCNVFNRMERTIMDLLNKVPVENRLNLLNVVFLDNDSLNEQLKDTKSKEIEATKKLIDAIDIPKYQWYRIAPFEIAFQKITKLLEDVSDKSIYNRLIDTLLQCTGKNPENISMVLNYYKQKQKKSPPKSINKCINSIIKYTDFKYYNLTAWNVFNDILNHESLDEKYVKEAVLCKVLIDKEIPASLLQKIEFDTYETYVSKLNKCDGEKLFNFLRINIMSKVVSQVLNETHMDVSKTNLENALKLLKVWDKELTDYPQLINRIKELTKLKHEKGWKVNLTSLYDIKKSWRKLMFEESLILHPSERVALNVLKHDPNLLNRFNNEVQTLRTDDSISLKQFLTKLRVYWSDTLAEKWSKQYIENLNTTGNHKSLTRSICILLPHSKAVDIIESYSPKEAKVNWENIDESKLSLQRYFAKNMHYARPQPKPQLLLLYAKGDYLQYSLPSLQAIFYNLSPNLDHTYVPKLLDAPVSLQKHGIRLAFQKFKADELNVIFEDIWKTSNNSTIRSVIFKFSFELLCNEKEPSRAIQLWNLFENFITNLSYKEDEKMYQLLNKVEDVPDNVKPLYIIKCYNFLSNLLPNIKQDRSFYEEYLENLFYSTKEVMENIDQHFIEELIQEYLQKDYFKNRDRKFRAFDGLSSVISAYILCANDEEDQQKKFKKVFVPLIESSFSRWDECIDGKFYIRKHFDVMLGRLAYDIKAYVLKNNKLLPTKIFTDILNELNKLPISENYVTITKWKLTVEMVNQLANTSGGDWNSKYSEIASPFAKACLEYLQNDVKTYFSCIYVIFTKALKMILDIIDDESLKMLTIELLLSNNEFVQAYLTAILLLPKEKPIMCDTYQEAHTEKILNIIATNPSVEVKLHYYNKFPLRNCGGESGVTCSS